MEESEDTCYKYKIAYPKHPNKPLTPIGRLTLKGSYPMVNSTIDPHAI